MRGGTRAAACVALLAIGGAAPGAAAQLEGEWRIEAAEHRFERFEGREGLYLQGGRAWLEGSSIRNGSIRFDLHAGGDLGFYGVIFRATDERNYEHIYIRPFLSGNPDATQYTPVFNGTSGWQIYAPPRFAGPLHIPTDRWIAVEIRFRDGRAALYVEGERIVYPELQHAAATGGIGLTSSAAPARFANVVVSNEPPPPIEAPAYEAVEPPPGIVTGWRLSETIVEDRLGFPGTLDRDLLAGLEWVQAAPAERGIVDIARARGRTPEASTVLAAFTVRAAQARTLSMEFGFSDAVVVYLNGLPLYRGADAWASRDYKFLGTIGLFDEVVLPLEVGENEVVLAVTEGFGGWGVTARLVDGEGVEVIGR